MKLATRHIIATAAVAAALGLGTPAHSEDWKPVGEFGSFAVSKAYQIEKGHPYWIGEFSSTFVNDKGEGSLFNQAGVKCPAFNDIDTNTKKAKAAGYCIISGAAGDQAYGSWQGEGDGVTTHGTYQWTGGTGKYKEITRNGTFTGHTQVNWQDGTSSGYATWNR
jgi:hypothetical protein